LLNERGTTMEKAELVQKIYDLVEKSTGKKKLKAGDIKKAFRPEGLSDDEIKAALKELMDEGRLIYTYFGGSYVEIPPKV
jgi:hypothetical protein